MAASRKKAQAPAKKSTAAKSSTSKSASAKSKLASIVVRARPVSAKTQTSSIKQSARPAAASTASATGQAATKARDDAKRVVAAKTGAASKASSTKASSTKLSSTKPSSTKPSSSKSSASKPSLTKPSSIKATVKPSAAAKETKKAVIKEVPKAMAAAQKGQQKHGVTKSAAAATQKASGSPKASSSKAAIKLVVEKAVVKILPAIASGSAAPQTKAGAVTENNNYPTAPIFASTGRPGFANKATPAGFADLKSNSANAAGRIASARVEIKSAPKPGSHRTGFKSNEFIVYPAHGVGQIVAIEEQEVAGFKLELFVISFAKDKMTLKVPLPKVLNGAIRKLADADTVKRSLDTLTGRARIKRTMWSRRAQEYEAKINSGDLGAIAEVVRDLYRSDAQPEQSYSERQLYEAALDRMAREVAAVNKIIDSEALKLIEGSLQKGPRRGAKADAASEAAVDVEIGEAA